MKTFQQRRTTCVVLAILTTIAVLVAAIFYIKFYNGFKDYDRNVIEAAKHMPKTAAGFIVVVAGFLFLAIMTIVKYSQLTDDFGPTFGAIFFRVIIMLEGIGIALFVLFLFI